VSAAIFIHTRRRRGVRNDSSWTPSERQRGRLWIMRHHDSCNQL